MKQRKHTLDNIGFTGQFGTRLNKQFWDKFKTNHPVKVVKETAYFKLVNMRGTASYILYDKKGKQHLELTKIEVQNCDLVIYSTNHFNSEATKLFNINLT